MVKPNNDNEIKTNNKLEEQDRNKEHSTALSNSKFKQLLVLVQCLYQSLYQDRQTVSLQLDARLSCRQLWRQIKPLGSSIRLCDFVPLQQSASNNDKKIHMVDSVTSGSEHEIENHCSELVVAADTDQTQDNLANGSFMTSNPNEKMDHTHDNLANGSFMTSNPNEKMDNQLVSVTHRGIRRRCLDFDMAGVRKNSDDNSNTGSSTTQSEVRNSADEMLIAAIKHDNLQQTIKCNKILTAATN